MANMQATKTPMPEQDPNVRNKNFKEVTLGYTAEMAINEAKRCLQCKKPHCVEGCPVNIHIPEFIHEVAEGNFEKAYEIITDTNALPALSGRVCPQETQCESKCVRGNKGEPVAIGRLERFGRRLVPREYQRHAEKSRVQWHQGRCRRLRPVRPDLRVAACQEGLCGVLI